MMVYTIACLKRSGSLRRMLTCRCKGRNWPPHTSTISRLPCCVTVAIILTASDRLSPESELLPLSEFLCRRLAEGWAAIVLTGLDRVCIIPSSLGLMLFWDEGCEWVFLPNDSEVTTLIALLCLFSWGLSETSVNGRLQGQICIHKCLCGVLRRWESDYEI